jgi:hypothetical protein
LAELLKGGVGGVASEVSRGTTISWASTSGSGKVVGFFEAFVRQLKDVEARLVAVVTHRQIGTSPLLFTFV